MIKRLRELSKRVPSFLCHPGARKTIQRIEIEVVRDIVHAPGRENCEICASLKRRSCDYARKWVVRPEVHDLSLFKVRQNSSLLCRLLALRLATLTCQLRQLSALCARGIVPLEKKISASARRRSACIRPILMYGGSSLGFKLGCLH